MQAIYNIVPRVTKILGYNWTGPNLSGGEIVKPSEHVKIDLDIYNYLDNPYNSEAKPTCALDYMASLHDLFYEISGRVSTENKEYLIAKLREYTITSNSSSFSLTFEKELLSISNDPWNSNSPENIGYCILKAADLQLVSFCEELSHSVKIKDGNVKTKISERPMSYIAKKFFGSKSINARKRVIRDGKAQLSVKDIDLALAYALRITQYINSLLFGSTVYYPTSI